ncbi:MAG: hypothetical protein ABIN57_06890 [Chitinophagaceae bacterium]
MKYFFLCCAFFSLVSCNNDTTADKAAGKDSLAGETIHANATDTIVTSAKPMAISGCYEMVFKKDSAEMNLILKDTVVTGTLHYNFYQKDENKGTIKGVLRNNMIYADYTFQSEGMTSVREVIFKIEDGDLVQAFGDIEEKNGKLYYTNKDQLQFQTANPFIKKDCE